MAADHFLYDRSAAVTDRITPVVTISPKEVWDYLWPREGADHVATVSTVQLLETARVGTHFPVLPDRSVLWQALQEGARENRWVLYFRGPNLAVGAQEMHEWPGTPRFDEAAEVWSYQAALDQGIYPRPTGGGKTKAIPLTAANLRAQCWPGGAAEVATEELERLARHIWADLSRPHLEDIFRDGVQQGIWAAWEKGTDGTFYTQDDTPGPTVQVGQAWALVDPTSVLAEQLEALRPGRGPQPVVRAGTPQEVFIQIWEELAAFQEVHVSEIRLTVLDRDSFDNTLLATWADRPQTAQVHASVRADGQREIAGKQETVSLNFEGRFEEIRSMLSPIWPFKSQGDLDMTIAVTLAFHPPLALSDGALEVYRTALMHANQGNIEVRVVPVRVQVSGGV